MAIHNASALQRMTSLSHTTFAGDGDRDVTGHDMGVFHADIVGWSITPYPLGAWLASSGDDMNANEFIEWAPDDAGVDTHRARVGDAGGQLPRA